MIHASADQINAIIAGDPALLHELHRFLRLADMEDGLGVLIDNLPTAVAACAPFEDEAALTDAVRRETLLALHRLALVRLPARGQA